MYTPNKKDKEKQLQELYKPYTACVQCPLGFLGRTNVVFGHGPVDAKIMIIGEAPGKDEDLQGLPFVGRSGKLLTKLLTSSNINREDVFITNIVKCRPPKNRSPKTIEVNICKNILLYNQIKIINPEIIITLGSIALNGLFNSKEIYNIKEERQKILFFNDIRVFATYHPAYILRNPNAANLFLEDLKNANAYLKNLDT